jgi:RHS repeat-associated protein
VEYFDKETNLHYNYFRDYDPGIGRYIQGDPIGLAGGSNTYTYVANDPLRFADPLGLATYMCTRRLNNVPFRAGPLYHQYICVGNSSGGFTCGGLVPTGSMFDSPGVIEPDKMKPQSCPLVEDDNDCVEKCIKDTFGKPPPNYSVDLSRGENCQTYADAAVIDCVTKCKVKRK